MSENLNCVLRAMLALPRSERHRAGIRTGNRDGVAVLLVRRELLDLGPELVAELLRTGALVSARGCWAFAVETTTR